MGSGVVYYEYEKYKKFENYDMKADAKLGIFKIRRYHFDDEYFVHPLHSLRFDLDRSYEILIEALMADQLLSSSKDEKSSIRRSRSSRRPAPQYSPKGMSSTQRVRSSWSTEGVSSFRRRMDGSSLRMPRSWELIPPSEGWICEGDNEKGIGGIEPSVKKEESSGEDPEEEAEDPEEEIPASSSLPMDIDAIEDYLLEINNIDKENGSLEMFPDCRYCCCSLSKSKGLDFASL
ncbi:hypothetical protein PIB30_038467 [Stylosanthes scabra]|uniref:Uncharacterized protein n=1 Tax=Stylosanthes scabra TaxID=79078 RepID=A0ABU6ZAY8_9FABA|nr:hypothetical protein [Stylosanthes scabra]